MMVLAAATIPAPLPESSETASSACRKRSQNIDFLKVAWKYISERLKEVLLLSVLRRLYPRLKQRLITSIHRSTPK